MIYAAVLAGGKGTRMQNTDIPKQFLELGDKAIIIHTVEKMLINPRIDKVYIGINNDWIEYCEDLVRKSIGDNDKVIIVPGGNDRNGTISNVLDDIESRFGLNDDDIILTHDAVRPFLTQRIIDENIDAAFKYGAVDTVIPASDTIINSLDAQTINSVPDRANLYQGQTPQTFNIKLLKECIALITDEEREILTDACKIFVLKGKPVHLVFGEVLNFKITTIGDYQMARAMIAIK
ncbi:MAG: 2-C-methyl-D-erythritol 4-phosphate cytidylyltransferase [Acutalibacteraceae bacterium]|nr:2-C-methyl-D-erythritol 4-phosphate cytidylyltransferase [Acutalibacteraceae bacterium]